jgi:hypothetical protein
MTKKNIPVRLVDGEFLSDNNARLRFNLMTPKELQTTIHGMNPTMSSFCLKKNGSVCALNDTNLEFGDYEVEIDVSSVSGKKLQIWNK